MKVSQNVRRHAAHLHVLSHCKGKQAAGLIKHASPDLIRAICECALNSLHGRVPHTAREKRILKRHKRSIKALVDKKIKQSKKRSLIIQKGKGFLPYILGPILSGLTSVAKSIFGGN